MTEFLLTLPTHKNWKGGEGDISYTDFKFQQKKNVGD